MRLKELLAAIKVRLQEKLANVSIISDESQISGESLPSVNIIITSGDPSDQEGWGRKKTISVTLEVITNSQIALLDLVEDIETAMLGLVSMKERADGATKWLYEGFEIDRQEVGSSIYSAIMNYSVDLIKKV